MSEEKGESATAEVKIVFTPSGRQGQVAKGTNLLQAARQLGVWLCAVRTQLPRVLIQEERAELN